MSEGLGIFRVIKKNFKKYVRLFLPQRNCFTEWYKKKKICTHSLSL